MYLVERPTDQKRHKSMHGLYRALDSEHDGRSI